MIGTEQGAQIRPRRRQIRFRFSRVAPERVRNHSMFENLAGQVWTAPHSGQKVSFAVAAVLCNRNRLSNAMR